MVWIVRIIMMRKGLRDGLLADGLFGVELRTFRNQLCLSLAEGCGIAYIALRRCLTQLVQVVC